MTSPTGAERPSRTPTIHPETLAIAALAVAAAVGAVLAEGRPTGLPVADAVFRGGFAALVTVAAAQARRWTWIVMSGLASVAAGGVWAAPAVGALAVSLGSALLDRRNRVLGALVGALSIQALLRLSGGEFNGSTALVAIAATAPALASAYQLASRRARRTVNRAASGAAVFCVLAAIGLGVATLTARTAVTEGITLAQAGFDSARDGEEASAVANLQGAQRSFADANDALTSPWALPSRVVPVLGLQARAVQDVTSEGENLTGVAATAADETDLDSLQFVDGRIDLELVAGFEQPLQDGADALQQAADAVEDLDSPWLVAPLDSRVAQFSDEVDDALPDAELAIAGVRVAPALFGGEGARNYFIAFTTPSESRGLGGFMGNWGELTAVDGDPELLDSGRIEDLNVRARFVGATLTEPEDYVNRYGRFNPDVNLQDMTFSPDMPSVSQVSADLYTQTTGRPMAGVIVVDPYALAALLTFTGPIQLSDYPTPLTAENAADILLREQYLTFDTRSDRKDFLDEATRVVFERLTSGDIPGPRQVAEVLGPLVRQGRLMVHSFDAEEQDLFEDVGLDGAFPEQPEGGDYFSVITQNAANNKIDMFLQRDISYEAEVDPGAGQIDVTATVSLTNQAPASGLPDVILSSGDRIYTGQGLPLGTNRVYLSFYSPHQLESASVAGQPLAMESERELGLNVYSAFVDIPPGATLDVEILLQGSIEPSEDYRLGVGMQPLVNADTVSATITGVGGWLPEPTGAATVNGPQANVALVTTDGDQQVAVPFRRD